MSNITAKLTDEAKKLYANLRTVFANLHAAIKNIIPRKTIGVEHEHTPQQKQTEAAQRMPLENVTPDPAKQSADNKLKQWLQQQIWEPINWSHILQLVGLIVGMVVAYVYWQELEQMANQTILFEEQANRAVIEYAGNSATTNRQLESIRDQAKAAQDSANAIQRQTEIGARPWLELSEIALKGGMTINMSGEANLQVHVVATNIGKTPAREVSLMVELGEHSTEHQEIHRLCTMNFFAPKGAGKYGQVLFPTKTLGEGENQGISIKLKPLTLVERKRSGTGYSEALRLDKNGPPPSQEELIYPIPSSVIGCIQYKSFTSDVPYYTGFIYEIFPMMKGREMFGYDIHFDRKTGNANNVPSTIPQGNGIVTIPFEWLRLMPNRGWGNDVVR
jgi:hypothetical protein